MNLKTQYHKEIKSNEKGGLKSSRIIPAYKRPGITSCTSRVTAKIAIPPTAARSGVPNLLADTLLY